MLKGPVWLSMFGLFLLATRSDAQTIALTGMPVINGESTTTAGTYLGVLLHVSSPNSDIRSIDFLSGSNGVSGPLIQRWHSSNLDGDYDITSPAGTARNYEPTDDNFDSHLLHDSDDDDDDATTISQAVEALGSGATIPPSGTPPSGELPPNTPEVGLLESGFDGSLKGRIDVVFSGIRQLDVAYFVFDTRYFSSVKVDFDVTTDAGTVHFAPRFMLPEPSASCLFPALAATVGLTRRRGATTRIWKVRSAALRDR